MSGGYQRTGGGNPLLGVPIMRCASCGALNQTGKLPWSAMTPWQRKWLLMGAVFRALIVGLVFSVVVGFALSLVLNANVFDKSPIPWITSLLGGEALSFLYSWRLYRRAIPLIEQSTAAQDWDSAPQVI
jgi:hypothetical protein